MNLISNGNGISTYLIVKKNYDLVPQSIISPPWDWKYNFFKTKGCECAPLPLDLWIYVSYNLDLLKDYRMKSPYYWMVSSLDGFINRRKDR